MNFNGGYKPLFYDRSVLICARRNKIFKLHDDGTEEFLFSIPTTNINLLFLHSRLLSRLLRLGVYSSVIHNNTYFFCFSKKLYSYNPKQKILSVEFYFEKGHGPLSFCSEIKLKGFSRTVYFGEYFSNKDLNAVRILKRNHNGTWVKCYEFAKGSINHIHRLVEDRQNNCIWILAGDFGSAAGIYRTTNNFTNVEKIVYGNQKYRSCVAFPLENGLLYATDSQFEKNSIRVLRNFNGEWISCHLFDTNGPVIYGCELKDFYIFSTSVEPGKLEKNLLLKMLDRESGPGIINDYVEIIALDKDNLKLISVSKNAKDVFPPRLFQFGSAMFPSVTSHHNIIHAYFTATKFNEGKIEVIDMKNFHNSLLNGSLNLKNLRKKD